jgi:hypothetical protein
MGLIEYYVIFAITTGLSSCYLFLVPAIQRARREGVVNSFTENTLLSYLVYIITSTLFAPLTIFPILFTNSAEKFMVGIERVVLEPNK